MLAAQVPLRHQVGVDVVVGHGGVLVGAGHAVDPEPAAAVVVPQRAPQPRRRDEQVDADLALELPVVGGAVAGHVVGGSERPGRGMGLRRAATSGRRRPARARSA